MAHSPEQELSLLQGVLKGHQDAIELVQLLARTSQTWDDLIDKDKLVTNADINRVFIELLSDLPRNPFYQQYFSELQPIVEATIIDWFTANDFEQEAGTIVWETKLKPMAWMLRDSGVSIVLACAKIIGGLDHAIRVAPIVRSFVHDEPLANYYEEH